MNCTKDIEIISKMYLVQFINPAKSLWSRFDVPSQKFGFACNDGDAPGIHPEGRRGGWISGEGTNQSKLAFGTGSFRSSYWSRYTVENI